MSYKSAPTTRLLATHCCACGRPLRDAKSVETGIGPVCRRKHGFGPIYERLTARQRKNVNKLIHAAGVACENDDIKKVLLLADKMEKTYKFKKVAEIVRARFVKIRIHRVENAPVYRWNARDRREEPAGVGNILRVWTPYSPSFTAERRNNLRGRPVKEKTEHGKFHWEFAEQDGVLLMRVLSIVFPVRAFVDQRGRVATIPSAKEFNATFAGDGIARIETGGRR